MIISKTPCRLSFAGGGSDIESYYREFGGAVVSVTIDKYVYLTLQTKFDHHIRIGYSRTEEVERVEDIQHPIVRHCLNMMGPRQGVEITSHADIPSRGSGLGSSSSFTVGLLNGLYAYQGRHASPQQLAEQACHVEINLCGDPIGKQDQFAAAFGGLRMYHFHPDGSVGVEPLICHAQTLVKLHRNLMMFYTGITRSAGEILKEQTQALGKETSAIEKMHRIVEYAHAVRHELENGNPEGVGEILHHSWMMKRSLANGISNQAIDDCYQAARSSGAVGGKILGAGGGGFLLLYVPQERQEAVKKTLGKLRQIPFSFERDGSKIIFYNPTTLDPEREDDEWKSPSGPTAARVDGKA
ncbi:MAG: galactokinase [Terracidiphilus sp.]|jgi:D-glycero-alpha-D-manno-heptose-7-phosphate kinase